MRTFINMRFVTLITMNSYNGIPAEELQTSYNEFIDAIVVASFAELEYRLRYNTLIYTLIELKTLRKELDCEAKKKCPRHYSSIQSN